MNTEKVLRIGARACSCGQHAANADTASRIASNMANTLDAPVPSNESFNDRVAQRGQSHDVKAFLGRGVPEPAADNAVELRAAADAAIGQGLPAPSQAMFNEKVRNRKTA